MLLKKGLYTLSRYITQTNIFIIAKIESLKLTEKHEYTT